MRKAVDHCKARGLDFSPIFYQPDVGADVGRFCQISQDHGLEAALDNTTLLALCKPALDERKPVKATLPIRNVNRVVGTIARQRGDAHATAPRDCPTTRSSCTSRARRARASAPSCRAA